MNWNARYANELAGEIVNIQPPESLDKEKPKTWTSPEADEYFDKIRQHLLDYDKVPAEVMVRQSPDVSYRQHLQGLFDAMHDPEHEFYTPPRQLARMYDWPETPLVHRCVPQRWTRSVDTGNHPSRGL